MEDREMPQMHKHGKSKATWFVKATVCHLTSGSVLRKFQAACFCWTEGTNNFLPTDVIIWIRWGKQLFFVTACHFYFKELL